MIVGGAYSLARESLLGVLLQEFRRREKDPGTGVIGFGDVVGEPAFDGVEGSEIEFQTETSNQG